MRDDRCIFCEIVKNNEQHKVHETRNILAFLDHRPLFPGHTLVIPKGHYQTIMETPDELIAELYFEVKLLSKAVRSAMGSEGIFTANNNIVSQSVPHLHIHIVPRNKKDGLKGFFWPRHSYNSDEHMAQVRDSIRSAVGDIAAAQLLITPS